MMNRRGAFLQRAKTWLLAGCCMAVVLGGGLARAQDKEASKAAQWRKAYADDLRKPDGWLSLVALEWLQEGDNSVGSGADNKIKLRHVPAHVGVLRVKAGSVQFTAVADGVAAGVLLDGKAGASGVVQADDSAHPSEIVSGDVRMTVIRRGDRQYLRVKDAFGPGRLHFHELAWYPYDPKLRVNAKWVPNSSPKMLNIVNVLGQMTPELSPGYAEFTIAGQTMRLEPTMAGDELFFDFRDLTSKTTTDGGGRFLTAGRPSNGFRSAGSVVLDFNYAHNPPCGYTPYATCPLPTEDNRLKVAIAAGEKRYAVE